MRHWPWRGWLLWGAALLLLAAVAAWLMHAFELADVEFRTPATGEAAANPLYAAQALARDMGAQVTRQTSLDPLPPPGATLVLTSGQWDLLPGRDGALRDWVRQGGHLVIPYYLVRSGEDNLLNRWLPVRWAKAKTKTETETRSRAEAQARPKPPPHGDPDSEDDADDENDSGDAGDTGQPGKPDCANAPICRDACRHLTETGESAGPGFRICDTYPATLELKPNAVAQWSASERGNPPALLRAAEGQGSVTAIGIWSAITHEDILKADHAQAWAAALRLRPGMALWFVAEESREPLLIWLWQRAWLALLLGLLALGAALWRAAPRFGPRQALPRVERRSMAEQIVGTAHFLARSDAQALHRAQLRALDEAAAPRLHRWEQLDLDARARAIAALTGLQADALARAMTGGPRHAANLEADLCCLETAARRLRSSSP
jgi:hypothetical protein